MIDHGRIVRAAKPRVAITVSYLFLIGWLLVTLFPIFWMVSTSFKPPLGWFAWPPQWLPADFTLDNYRQILTFGALASSTPDPESGFTRLVLSAVVPIRDSLIVAIASSTIAVTLGASLAYTIARFGTGGSRRVLYRRWEGKPVWMPPQKKRRWRARSARYAHIAS